MFFTSMPLWEKETTEDGSATSLYMNNYVSFTLTKHLKLDNVVQIG